MLNRMRKSVADLAATYPGTSLTLRRLANLHLGRWEQRRNRIRLRSYPIKLTVESTNICNLRCPACFTGADEFGRPRRHFDLELFRALMRELGPYLLEVEFHNWGEPLLARHLFDMIEEATRYAIHSTVSTNFSLPFDAARAERLVRSGLCVLGVSIDGARQSTYEQYRRHGDLDTVLRNCRLVLQTKRRLGTARPRMIWEFHVFEHNQGDVERAQVMARELEMDIAINRGWVVGPDQDLDPQYRYFADPEPTRCHFLWGQAVVNPDGGVSPCCGAFYREDDVGTFALSAAAGRPGMFREVWNGPRLQQARALFRSREAHAAGSSDLICRDCPRLLIWDGYQRHVSAGRDPATFEVGYTTNQCFQFFWNRRPVSGGEARRDAGSPRSSLGPASVARANSS
jgi:organic radical activating enzyme